ncbi:hypothetical protein H744_2c2159 [Photobacterium gaetbulicola Gung47]|uniref:Uncharacterized protein n=1 Tax=Photobacterium gaetbulicola Gung47 TaxID=658445 RepID=A0A0C5WNX7_9GAMM|nr:hypothetical protein H744_2c2159 [Photobacterium gaetbulicola Gung47]
MGGILRCMGDFLDNGLSALVILAQRRFDFSIHRLGIFKFLLTVFKQSRQKLHIDFTPFDKHVSRNSVHGVELVGHVFLVSLTFFGPVFSPTFENDGDLWVWNNVYLWHSNCPSGVSEVLTGQV